MIEVPLYIMNLYHLSMNNQDVYDNIMADLFSLMIPVYASYSCSILDEWIVLSILFDLVLLQVDGCQDIIKLQEIISVLCNIQWYVCLLKHLSDDYRYFNSTLSLWVIEWIERGTCCWFVWKFIVECNWWLDINCMILYCLFAHSFYLCW